MISNEAIESAAQRIGGKIVETPLSFDADLNVYLKWENHQKTGAFKVRGALNKILALESWEQERGLVGASAGNHGLGVAYAARMVGAKATVFIPENSAQNKEEAIIQLGATVIKVPGGYSNAEKEAQSYAIRRGATWVSPYNDEQVIAGQATIGLELVRQIQPFNAQSCLIPVSGGALIAGIGLAFQSKAKKVKIIGVQSENAAFFYSLYHYGTQKEIFEKASVADGLSGAVEWHSITIPIVRSMLDDFVLVNEEEIEKAIAYAWYRYNEVLEGSAAVSLAAVLFNKAKIAKSILIISGGNIGKDHHRKICERWKDYW
jgi:threonine dehydratase